VTGIAAVIFSSTGRRSVPKEGTEVSFHDALEPAPILDVQGLVEAERLLQAFADFRARLRVELRQAFDGRAGRELDDDERNEADPDQ
jgi:hypothetical protein